MIIRFLLMLPVILKFITNSERIITVVLNCKFFYSIISRFPNEFTQDFYPFEQIDHLKSFYI